MSAVTLRYNMKRPAEMMGVVCVEEVFSRGRLRWYEQIERKDKSDWVSVCRELQVEGLRVRGNVERRGISM